MVQCPAGQECDVHSGRRISVYFVSKRIISFNLVDPGLADDDGEREHPPGIQVGAGQPAGDPTPETPAAGGPPQLDSAFGDHSARERLYSVLEQTRDPTPVVELATDSDCHADTAQKYLDWFAQLGIATRHEGRPTRYERNEAYFEWCYVSELADRHSLGDFREHVRTIRERLDAYREQYDGEAPSRVDARAVADEDTPIEDVWGDIATWLSLEDELRFSERARQ